MMQERKPIQQHYFTREREGVFRTNEGFDTVAMSPGMDVGLLKTRLHPYCVYKPPQELLARAEQDESLYPQPLVVFHAENGDMVIGRSVYVGTDFTGQRSASFSHQFLVPKERKDELIREPQRLFGINAFQSSYDIRSGKALPELDAVGYDPSGYSIGEQDKLLASLGIDRTRFQQLIYTIMSSVANRKKVYIVLDTDISESAESAKRLLSIFYRCLPFEIRRQLGFTTFNSEPEAKQHLHLLFVEKGSIRTSDRNIDKGFAFDFPNDRFINTELPGPEHPLLDYVWTHRNDPERLDRFFEFCEEALQGLSANTALSVPSYYQLFSLYEVEQGGEALYEANRAGIIHGITTYATADTMGQKGRLNELFIRLLRKDAMDGETLPTAEYIKSLLHYYTYAEEGVKTLLIRCFVLFISRVASRSDAGIGEAAPIFDQLLAQQAVFGLVMKELYTQQAGTAESYVAHRMGKAGTAKELLGEIRFWVQHGEHMVQQRFFANEVLKKVKQLLQTDNFRKRLETAGTIYRYLDELPKSQGKPQYEDFCGQLKLEISLDLLEGIRPGELDYEDFMQLGFMLATDDRELISHLGRGQKLTLQLLSAIYRVLTHSKQDDSELIEAIDVLGPLDLERVQGSLKRLLGTRISTEHFGQIVYAFYEPNFGKGAGYMAEFDYYGMLEFIESATPRTDTIYDFLVWSAGDNKFLNARDEMDGNYKAAVGKYFDIRDPRAFRQKQISQKLLATPNQSFAAFFKAVKLRQSGKLVRFFHKNKRKLIRSALLALPVVVMLIILRNPLLSLLSWMGPAPVLAVDSVPAVSTTSTLTLKAIADDGDSHVKLYINGQLVGSGSSSTTVELKDGDNSFDFKAVNSRGKESQVIRKQISYKSPAPTVTVEAIPDVSRTNTITVKASAADGSDPSPTIYINGQAAGQKNAAKTITLTTGDNTIEIKATNKLGKTSEPIVKKVKYEPAAAGSTGSR